MCFAHFHYYKADKVKKEIPYQKSFILVNIILFAFTGVRIAKGKVDTRAFQEAGIRLSERLHPVCAQEGSLHSYSYWLCYIKHMTLTGPHSVGTCKMGPDSDTSAVVDNQLRYYIVVTGVSLGPSPYLYNFSLKYK